MIFIEYNKETTNGELHTHSVLPAAGFRQHLPIVRPECRVQKKQIYTVCRKKTISILPGTWNKTRVFAKLHNRRAIPQQKWYNKEVRSVQHTRYKNTTTTLFLRRKINRTTSWHAVKQKSTTPVPWYRHHHNPGHQLRNTSWERTMRRQNTCYVTTTSLWQRALVEVPTVQRPLLSHTVLRVQEPAPSNTNRVGHRNNNREKQNAVPRTTQRALEYTFGCPTIGGGTCCG